MHVISRIFDQRTDALAALDAVGLLAVDGVTALTTGEDLSGRRFDIAVSDVVASTGRMIPGPENLDGSPGLSLPEVLATGEVQVDVWWGGVTPPIFESGRTSAAPLVSLSPPPAADVLPLAAAKFAARKRVLMFADGITARITGRYPASEVASWPTQEAEARAAKAGAGVEQTPLLATMAAMRGQTVDELATSVLGAADQYRKVVAAVQVMHRQTLAVIDTAESVDALDAGMVAAAHQAQEWAKSLGVSDGET